MIADEPHADWEAKMRELSGQLSTILMQIKKAKENRPSKHSVLSEKQKPKVTVLRNVSEASVVLITRHALQRSLTPLVLNTPTTACIMSDYLKEILERLSQQSGPLCP